MRLDVTELERFYYDSDLGKKAKDLINRVLFQKIKEDHYKSIVGFGFPCPFFEKIVKKNDKDLIVLMPGEQGVISWPKRNNSVTALVDELSWPVNTSSADLILIAHGLEVSNNQDLLLREALRVLNDTGKLIILVPNRTGFWARSEITPFGYGKPYTTSQLTKLLQKNQFQIDRITPSLFGIPARKGYLLRSIFLWEALGKKLNNIFLGGLLIVEARKDIYAVNKVKSSSSRSYFRSMKIPVSTFTNAKQ